MKSVLGVNCLCLPFCTYIYISACHIAYMCISCVTANLLVNKALFTFDCLFLFFLDLCFWKTVRFCVYMAKVHFELHGLSPTFSFTCHQTDALY